MSLVCMTHTLIVPIAHCFPVIDRVQYSRYDDAASINQGIINDIFNRGILCLCMR